MGKYKEILNVVVSSESGGRGGIHTRVSICYYGFYFSILSFVEIISAGDQQAILEQDDIATVFTPNNSAFEYAGRPEQSVITEFLNDHMIAGSFDLQSLKAAMSENGWPITLKSVSGKTLKIYHMDGKIKPSGLNGVLATITHNDMMHSNDVMHEISDILYR